MFTTSSVFFYNRVFLKNEKKNTHKTFHTLKMKAHFEKEPDFENKSLLQTESNKKRAES